MGILEETKISEVANISSVVAVTGSTATLLNANNDRCGFMIYNESTAICYLKYGGGATSASYSVQIPANTLYESPTDPVWIGVVTATWAAANGNARVTEFI